MRILLLWDYDRNYLSQFYVKNPAARDQPYEEQKRLLLEDGYHWPSYLIHEFRKRGHHADTAVGNAAPAQAMWARENGIHASATALDIVREQIRRYRPDVLWTCSRACYLGEFLRSIRDSYGRVVVWHAEPGAETRDWTGVDCVFTSHTNLLDLFRGMGLRSERVLPCVSQELVSACMASIPQRNHDVLFYGLLTLGTHETRIRFLDAVTRQVSCTIHANPISWRRRPWPLGMFVSQLRHLPFYLRTRFQPPVFGRDLLRLIASSRIVLNTHGTHGNSAKDTAGNIRMFEATAMGALLMTDALPNVSTLFEPDREIVTYTDANDAVKKLLHLLNHPSEIEAIARAGQERALRCYNSNIRAQEVLKLFDDLTRK